LDLKLDKSNTYTTSLYSGNGVGSGGLTAGVWTKANISTLISNVNSN
jgi:hypothetical protein